MAGDRTTRIHAVSATIKPEAAVHHATPRETTKILGDCRDLAISRLTISFAQMMDRVGELLMDRANKSDVREEQQLYLDARHALKGERPALMAEFEKQLRRTINERIAGKTADKVDFSKADAANLTLVETSSMDESVLTGNITRIVENLSHDELLTLNRGPGSLVGSTGPWHGRQSHFARGHRRGFRRGAEDRQDRPAHQVPDPEGAEPGADG
jgi:hypothetical protein